MPGKISVPFGYPLHRLEEFGRLTHSELNAVIKISGKPYVVKRGHAVRREGDPVLGFYLLFEGWVLASTLLPNEGVWKVPPSSGTGTQLMIGLALSVLRLCR